MLAQSLLVRSRQNNIKDGNWLTMALDFLACIINTSTDHNAHPTLVNTWDSSESAIVNDILKGLSDASCDDISSAS